MIAPFLAGLLAAALGLGGLWLRQRRRLRQLQHRLDQLADQVRTAEQAREAFFDLVTHELRSPLSAVLGYQELLCDGAYGSLPEGSEEAIDRIGRSAQHLLHLIDGVVELSRLRSQSVRPDLAPVDLGVLLSAAADAFRRQAAERHLRPVVRTPDRLGIVRSDQDRLLRAIDLLITSAVKHPAGPEICLEIQAHDDGATLRICDTDLELRRADDPALRLGIRLAVADRIACLLGGELTLEPDTGEPVRALTLRIVDASLPAPAGGGL